jgi:osmotically-inducible protein OsmY
MSRITVFGVSALLFLGSGLAWSEAPDAWLTTKAKIALLTTDGVSATAVNVDTVDGKVTIHGKVKTAEEKAKAEAEVKKLDGVKHVQNLLQVVPEEQRKVVNASDDAIKDSVQNALKGDPVLEGVKVASVNKGVVLLSGETKTLDAKLKAIEVSLAAPGVRRVATEEQRRLQGTVEAASGEDPAAVGPPHRRRPRRDQRRP